MVFTALIVAKQKPSLSTHKAAYPLPQPICRTLCYANTKHAVNYAKKYAHKYTQPLTSCLNPSVLVFAVQKLKHALKYTLHNYTHKHKYTHKYTQTLTSCLNPRCANPKHALKYTFKIHIT